MSQIESKLRNTGYVVARAYRGNVFNEDGELVKLGECVWEERGQNIIPDEGISATLQAVYTQETAAPAALYVGLLGNYTPVTGTTMANIGANEVTNYTEGTRQVYSGAEASKTASNSASPAAFTIGAGGDTVYGAFLSSGSVKGGTTGTCFGAKLFTASRALIENDVLSIVYEVAGSST